MKGHLSNIPWKLVRQVGYAARKQFFTVDVPDNSYITVNMDYEHVENVLRERNMRSGWVLSYNYHGEDANLVRPYYVKGSDKEWQLHVRLFDNGNGTCDLHAHTELCPMNHPKGHIEQNGMDIIGALRDIEGILVEEGIEHTVVG